jgi:hypothetical protein
LFTGCCYGVVSGKAYHATATIFWCIVLSISTRVLWQVPAEQSSSEAGRNLATNGS